MASLCQRNTSVKRAGNLGVTHLPRNSRTTVFVAPPSCRLFAFFLELENCRQDAGATLLLYF